MGNPTLYPISRGRVAGPLPAANMPPMEPLTSAGIGEEGRTRAADKAGQMTPAERRSSLWLSLLSGSRMLGMFLILPVFAVHAAAMPGGVDSFRVGLAMGIYGLTQALLQIPFGMASDRYGRKPVITVGLLLMVLGSVIAAMAQTVDGLTIGRAIQGAGAVSAAIAALLADNTRDSQRSKAMAMLGAMIGVAFAISLIVSPPLYRQVGLSGLFLINGVIAVLGIGLLWWRVPNPPQGAPALAGGDGRWAAGAGAAVGGGADTASQAGAGWGAVIRDPDLLRLNIGIFVLHLLQMSLFLVVPGLLVQSAGLPLPEHWKVYLPVVGGAFVLMLPLMNRAERQGRLRPVFLGGIWFLTVAMIGLVMLAPTLTNLIALLLVFFIGFNLLEALLPSLISRLAPAGRRGLAMGVYNTAQALGLFCGGLLGGWLLREAGPTSIFGVGLMLLAIWWLAARGQRRWPGRDGAGSPTGRPMGTD